MMKIPYCWLDFGCAITISLLITAIGVLTGDPLRMGWEYYFYTLIIFCGFAALFLVKPFFLSGTASIMAILFLPFILINIFSNHSDDLIIFAHLSILPGAVFGLIMAIIISKTHDSQRSIKQFFYPVWCIGLGCFINELILFSL